MRPKTESSNCLQQKELWGSLFPYSGTKFIVSTTWLFGFTGVCPVSELSLKYNLTQKGTGNAVAIVVGGAAEAILSLPGVSLLYLKNRKGFIKIALKTGWVSRFGDSLIMGPWASKALSTMTPSLGNPTYSLLWLLPLTLYIVLGMFGPLDILVSTFRSWGWGKKREESPLVRGSGHNCMYLFLHWEALRSTKGQWRHWLGGPEIGAQVTPPKYFQQLWNTYYVSGLVQDIGIQK